MNPTEFQTIIAWIANTWRNVPMDAPRRDIFRMELEHLDAHLVLQVLREHWGDDPFPPSPIRVARAVERIIDPRPELPDPDEVYNEVMDGIARYGWTNPEPDWSHPAIGQMVAARGGWLRVCQDTPARNVFDSDSMTAAQVFKAQFRDDWRALGSRYQRAEERARYQVGSADRGELDE